MPNLPQLFIPILSICRWGHLRDPERDSDPMKVTQKIRGRGGKSLNCWHSDWDPLFLTTWLLWGSAKHTQVCHCALTWLWEKRELIFLSQEACGLELFFFSYFFFPLFVVIYGLARGEALRYRGVSLLFHYISESLPRGEWNAKQGHLTSSLAGPRTARVTPWLGSRKCSFQYIPHPTISGASSAFQALSYLCAI